MRPFVLFLSILASWKVAADSAPKKVAAIVTEYRHNSHADIIAGRLFQTFTLDDKGKSPELELVSLFIDQFPEKDTGRKWSAEYGIPIYGTIRDALTLGGKELAVDGVMLIAEHGDYPENQFGSTLYPKERFFRETEKVFRESGKTVPVFVDKHLGIEWEIAKRSYEVSRELSFPIIAGSSLPLTWRKPPADVRGDAEVKEILVTTYGHPVSYGFHALEILQCLAEKRPGGEVGVSSVRYIEGEAVWDAGRDGVFDPELLNAALGRGLHRSRLYGKKPLEELVKKPFLYHVEYKDGLVGNIINTQNAVWEWSAAWKLECGEIESTLFWTQEERPYGHFSFIVKGIEQTFQNGRPAWPTERTLLTTGMLDALLRSKAEGGRTWRPPHLQIPYQSSYRWEPPPPPPPARPWNSQ
jgi:hypothetical protein